MKGWRYGTKGTRKEKEEIILSVAFEWWHADAIGRKFSVLL